MRKTDGTLFIIRKGLEIIRIWADGQPMATDRVNNMIQFTPDCIARCGQVNGTSLIDFLHGKTKDKNTLSNKMPEFIIYERGTLTAIS